MRVTFKQDTAACSAWLSASVPPEVKQMERAGQFKCSAILRRLVSTNALAFLPTAWEEDGLPCTVWYTSIMAATTSGATGVVAALSKYTILMRQIYALRPLLMPKVLATLQRRCRRAALPLQGIPLRHKCAKWAPCCSCEDGPTLPRGQISRRRHR